MYKSVVAVVLLCTVAVYAQDPAPSTEAPTLVVVATTPNPEKEKLASKDWAHYRGCEDTCFSLCVEKPADFDNKCSTLFSNNTVAAIPAADSCRKPELVQACTYQCLCACKRCGFCKQDLVNACEADAHPVTCFDGVLDSIISGKMCD